MKSINEDIFNPFNSKKLFGLNSYFNDLVNLIEKNKFPKVLLLSGDKGIGKFTLSFHLINYYFSINTNHPYDTENFSINSNDKFYKNVLSNTQENFFHFENINKKTSIEDIREIKNKYNKPPLNNLPRFTIIDDVELLNLNAVNSILKLIEEPLKSDYFILIFNKREKIIETLKSRSIEIKFFLSQKQKDIIYKNLLETHKISTNMPENFKLFSTPGQLLRFTGIYEEISNDINSPLFDIASILLDKYKKTKNYIYLDFLNLIINKYFVDNRDRTISNTIRSINSMINILGLIKQYRKFNLSNSSVLEFLK